MATSAASADVILTLKGSATAASLLSTLASATAIYKAAANVDCASSFNSLAGLTTHIEASFLNVLTFNSNVRYKWAEAPDPTTSWTDAPDPSTIWADAPDPSTSWTPADYLERAA